MFNGFGNDRHNNLSSWLQGLLFLSGNHILTEGLFLFDCKREHIYFLILLARLVYIVGLTVGTKQTVTLCLINLIFKSPVCGWKAHWSCSIYYYQQFLVTFNGVYRYVTIRFFNFSIFQIVNCVKNSRKIYLRYPSIHQPEDKSANSTISGKTSVNKTASVWALYIAQCGVCSLISTSTVTAQIIFLCLVS